MKLDCFVLHSILLTYPFSHMYFILSFFFPTIQDLIFHCKFVQIVIGSKYYIQYSNYTAGHPKCNNKTDQIYLSQIYLWGITFYKDQMIGCTTSCEVRKMMKSVVTVAATAGYNHCCMPRHWIKDNLDVLVGYSSPCCFHILPKLIWCSSTWCILGQSFCNHRPDIYD